MFINDRDAKDIGGDDSTKAMIGDNNGATRVRANGHSELEDGSTVGIQFEYALDADVTLRHANVQFTNPVAGKITVGQGSEAGDGSAGLGPGVTGIGAGQAGFATYTGEEGDAIADELGIDRDLISVTGLGVFFSSLDGGGRTNMIRYDTPALGSVSAAASVGNNDSVSGLIVLKSEFSGTSFGAQVGWHKQPRGAANGVKAADTPDPSELSASFGVTMPSGLAVGGAWGKGKHQTGVLGAAATQAEPAVKAKYVDPSYGRLGIGYTFGDSTVAASWYKSQDFVVEKSKGTALGIGASHTLPKVGATLHASVQNYKVDLDGLKNDLKETVFQIGTLVTF